MSWTAGATGLAPLGAETRAALDALVPATVPAGTVLFRPGDAAQGFVIVLSGRVDVFLTGPNGREILLYSVRPGQSCIQTTLGLLGDENYAGEAITHEECRIVLVPRARFLTLMDHAPDFRGFVFSAFAQRMQTMMHVLEKLAFQRVEARLAEHLLDVAGPDGVVSATQAELAVAIGSAREVVSRRLDALARRGIVQSERGRVLLRDPAALREIAATG